MNKPRKMYHTKYYKFLGKFSDYYKLSEIFKCHCLGLTYPEQACVKFIVTVRL